MVGEGGEGKDYSACNPNFIVGIEFLRRGMMSQASHSFEMAYEKTAYSDKYYNKYASFCGYARVMEGDRGGLSICREAARNERKDADVFCNLAKSEWHYKNRKRTVSSLLRGINIDKAHLEMRDLCNEVCLRKKVMISFLPRDHAINNFIGKWFRK